MSGSACTCSLHIIAGCHSPKTDTQLKDITPGLEWLLAKCRTCAKFGATRIKLQGKLGMVTGSMALVGAVLV